MTTDLPTLTERIRAALDCLDDDNDAAGAAQILRAALAAAPSTSPAAAAEQAGRWQPIETAPKNGYMLVHEDGAIRALLRIDGVWHKPGYPAIVTPTWGDVLVGDDAKRALPAGYRLELCDGCCENPTHWMPLPAAPSASPAEAPADPTDEDRRTALVKIGQAAIAVGWRDGDLEDFVRDRLLAAHHQPVAPAGQAAAGVQGEQATDEREAFESWAHASGFNIHRDESDKYKDYHRATTRFARDGWLSALAWYTRSAHPVASPAPAVERGAAAGGQGENPNRNDPVSAIAIRAIVAKGYCTQEQANECFSLACDALEAEAARMNVELPWVTRVPAPAVERGVAEERFEAWFDDPKSADNTQHYEIPASAHGEVKRLVRDIAQRAWIAALSTAGKEQA